MRPNLPWYLPGLVGLLVSLPAWSQLSADEVVTTNSLHHLRWETAISEFEAMDRTNPPPTKAVLLIGSSSIRKWTNAPAEFPAHQFINRGFGGSHLSDTVAFVGRIVIPYHPRLILLYAGDNDLAAGTPPEQVCADFKEFVAKVRTALPETRVAFIAIKPSPSRLEFIQPIKTANRLIQEFIAGDPKLAYVDVFTPMLGEAGQPRAELFVGDRLHLSDAGYKLWAGIIKPVLEK